MTNMHERSCDKLSLSCLCCLSPAGMDPNKVAEMILQGKSHKDISNEYKRLFPAKKGFSERSVRRYCQKHGLHKPKGQDLDSIVEKSVTEVYILYMYV